jgi:hypothetical protein
MAVYAGPTSVFSGVTYCLDAATTASYPGSGVTWNDRINTTTARATVLDNGPVYSATNGGVIGFDGTNDMGKIPNIFPFSRDGSVGLSYATFELWYRGKGDTTISYILTKPWNGQGEYNYLMTHTSFFVSGGSAFVSTSFTYPSLDTQTWRHLVYWMSPTQMGYYFDGGATSATKSQNAWTGTIPPSGNSNLSTVLMSLYPYASGWAGNSSFSTYGDVAMLRIYNRVLTADEVKTNYESIRGRFGL